MKISEIKTTLYDIFAYLFPGALIILLTYITFQHFKKVFDITIIVRNCCSLLDFKTTIGLSIIAYFVGHVTSTVSSFIVEKNIFCKIPVLSKKIEENILFSSGMFEIFKKKYLDTFDLEYQSKDFRSVICYVESKEPAIYSTAFVFLSFYGMSRCIAFSLSIFVIFELIAFIKHMNIIDLYYCIGLLLLSLVFYYEYFRFFRYYKQEIMMGFVLPKTKDN